MKMADAFSTRYQDLLAGTYDCVDRIVLNAYFPLAQSPGGFRHWWRTLCGGDDTLDDTHVMRFAGHFSRRVQAFAKKSGIPLIFCDRGERKHEVAEPHVPSDPAFRGVFCILVGRAPAPVRKVKRFGKGGIDIHTPKPYRWVNHYSFHIMDFQWGHVIIKLCPHPPFNAQIILNAHEYVARQAQRKGMGFTKEGNCFTEVSDAAGLAKVADTMSAASAVGRLVQVCERWIYSACLCFALTREEQDRTRFRYQYSVYQAEYSRNLLFTRGRQMEQVFDSVIDRTRAPLNIRTVKTIFGYKHRPFNRRGKKSKPPKIEVVVERPAWNLTVFKIHFGRLTVKIYSKGEHVLRIEAIAHNTEDLRCGRRIDRFPEMVVALKEMVEHFLEVLHSMDAAFIDSQTWQDLSAPSLLGDTRMAGLDLTDPRTRAVIQAVVALAPNPQGFCASDVAAQVNTIRPTCTSPYRSRQAAYDLKKLRAKSFISKIERTRRYELLPEGLSTLMAIDLLYNKVINPLLAAAQTCTTSPLPQPRTQIDAHYTNILNEMQGLFRTVGIAA
jgi:hypothetical protein